MTDDASHPAGASVASWTLVLVCAAPIGGLLLRLAAHIRPLLADWVVFAPVLVGAIVVFTLALHPRGRLRRHGGAVPRDLITLGRVWVACWLTLCLVAPDAVVGEPVTTPLGAMFGVRGLGGVFTLLMSVAAVAAVGTAVGVIGALVVLVGAARRRGDERRGGPSPQRPIDAPRTDGA
jgi:hypothetical protein